MKRNYVEKFDLTMNDLFTCSLPVKSKKPRIHKQENDTSNNIEIKISKRDRYTKDAINTHDEKIALLEELRKTDKSKKLEKQSTDDEKKIKIDNYTRKLMNDDKETWKRLKKYYIDTNRINDTKCPMYELILKLYNLTNDVEQYNSEDLKKSFDSYYILYRSKLSEIFQTTYKKPLLKNLRNSKSIAQIVGKLSNNEEVIKTFMLLFGSKLPEGLPKVRNRKVKIAKSGQTNINNSNNDDAESDVEGVEEGVEESDEEGKEVEQRPSTKEMMLNRGLVTRKKKKNIGRVRNRVRYQKAMGKYYSSQPRPRTDKGDFYEGERNGIRRDVIRSHKAKY